MLINADGSRNIAFKVETFVRIMATLYEEFVKQLGRSNADASRIASTIIAKAGYKSGGTFGWAMRESFQQNRKPLNLRQKIDKWCDFDSDVGFGLLKPDGDIESSDDLSFGIKLENNFVVHKRDTDRVNLCSFMAGYIQGVLERITERPLKVTHKSNECEQVQPEQDFCIFHVEVNKAALEDRVASVSSQYADSELGFDFSELEDAFSRAEEKKSEAPRRTSKAK